MKRALLACVVVIGCGPDAAPARDQWRVTLTTDAPLPQLGDRVLVEVIDEHGDLACVEDVGCRRTFAAGPASWPLSFGIAATGAGLRVRARLHRSSYVGAQGLPDGNALVERVGKLPEPNGADPVWLHLPAHCFGVASDATSNASCDPDSGALEPEPMLGPPPPVLPMPNTWAPAEPVACAGSLPADMKCVPGGVLLLGDHSGVELVPGIGPRPEHLVAISPFGLDTDEVTVGHVRQLALDGELSSLPTPHSTDLGSIEGACTFPEDVNDASRDALPVNCIDHARASAICAALGKRLPTEAEWEFAAANRSLETTYPWGDASDVCARAVVGRGRTDIVLRDPEGIGLEDSGCRVDAAGEILPWGPVAGGHPGDVNTLGIKNLAGNVREFVADVFAPYSAPCWQSAEVPLWNPRCDAAPSLEIEGANARGGGWSFMPLLSRVWMRVPGNYAPLLGVRCAVSAGP
jgi:formylglycine-generating enzyme required for sulfatase activity